MSEIPGDKPGEMEHFMNCHSRWLTGTVQNWWERRQFIRRFPQTQVPFFEVNPRDRAFDLYYESKWAEFYEMGEKGNAWLPGKRPTLN